MLQVDRLYEAVAQRGPVCVGLDTDPSYLPEGFAQPGRSKGENIVRFNKKLIDATKAVAGCYKVQIAYYEALGLDGMLAYKSTLEYLRREGLVAIADIKRGDIAKTAEMYARAHFTGELEADWMTLAPYMGLDSIEPYDYSGLKEFSTAYLPGFLADKYDVSVKDSQKRADTRCASTLEDALRGTVTGYDSCTLEHKQIDLKRGKVHYALLPVWMLHTKWNGQDFLFAMNGQTGKMVGDLPTSKGKFWGLFAAIAAPMTVVLTIILMLS